MKYLVLTRETTKQSWRNDSGYEHKGQAHGRVRLLRRFADMLAMVEEVAELPPGLPVYNNCKTLKELQSIRTKCSWGTDATFAETNDESAD